MCGTKTNIWSSYYLTNMFEFNFNMKIIFFTEFWQTILNGVVWRTELKFVVFVFINYIEKVVKKINFMRNFFSRGKWVLKRVTWEIFFIRLFMASIKLRKMCLLSIIDINVNSHHRYCCLNMENVAKNLWILVGKHHRYLDHQLTTKNHWNHHQQQPQH